MRWLIHLCLTPPPLLPPPHACLTDEEHEQFISLWEWTVDREGPLYTSPIEVGNVQTCIQFNPSDIREVVTTGTQRVVFWSWHAKKVCVRPASSLGPVWCAPDTACPVRTRVCPVQVLLAPRVTARLPTECGCIHHDHVSTRHDTGSDSNRGW